MKVRYRITDQNKRIIFCNLLPAEITITNEIKKLSCKFDNGRGRCGFLATELGAVYAFTNDKELILTRQSNSTSQTFTKNH